MEIDWDAPMSEIAVSLGSMKLGMQHIQLRGDRRSFFLPPVNSGLLFLCCKKVLAQFYDQRTMKNDMFLL